MNRGIISTRYAKALLSYALEKGADEAVYLKMKQLSTCFLEVPGFEKALSSPVIAAMDKFSIIRTASGNITNNEFDQFINLVIKNNREYLLRSISLGYINLYFKQNNVSICNLTTAVPMTEEIEAKISKMITDKTHGSVEFNKSVNPDILGGFIFELNYNRLDASIATQLKRIKIQLETINNY